MDHLSKAHGWLCRLLCRLGFIQKGFGNLEGEFRLGNDYLHRLTASANMMVRTDMEDYEGDQRFAEYTTFSATDNGDNYRVTIDVYRGTARESLQFHSQPIRYDLFIVFSGAYLNKYRCWETSEVYLPKNAPEILN